MKCNGNFSLEKHRQPYTWLQETLLGSHSTCLQIQDLHSEKVAFGNLSWKRCRLEKFVLNSFVWRWTLQYHVSHHLLGEWLSPGHRDSDWPGIGRWIQVQGGQKKFDRLPWSSLMQQINNNIKMNSLMHEVTRFSYLSESLTLRSRRVASDLKPLINFWHHQI